MIGMKIATVTTLILVLLISGCSIIQPMVNKSTDEAAIIVDKYCSELSNDVRIEIRGAINSKVSEGNSIEIKCKEISVDLN